MLKNILFLLLLFSVITVQAKVDYDSLITVIEESTDRQDFFRLDSILFTKKTEVNSIKVKAAVYIAYERTKTLHFEYYYAKFALRKSVIETIHGNLGEATNLAYEALHIFLKLNSIYASACYNTIAGMTAQQGDSETAIVYIDKAFEILDRYKSDSQYQGNLSNNYLMRGYIYVTADSLVKAEKNINKTLLSIDENSDVSTQIYCYLNLSVIEKKRANYELSIEYAEIALEICKVNNSYNLEAVTYLKIAEIYEEMDKIDAALVKYHQAEKIGLQQNLQIRLLKIYKAIYVIYKVEHNMNMAFEYQEKYVLLLEKQKQQEKDEQLQLLQIQFKVNEKNAQIAVLDFEKKHDIKEKKLLKIAVAVTITASILLISIIILIFSRYRLNKRIVIEQQEKEMAIYQMIALKSQMNPHFIFNALNSIQALILKEKTEESYTYIAKFAQLVRKTLNHSEEEFIDVEEECKSIEIYLELEKLRFKENLIIDFETNDIVNILIPPLLIQPFIENALKHGLFHKKGMKHLRINLKLKDETLICTISDNGIGRKAANKIQERRKKLHSSFSTRSIEDRFSLLRKIYGKNIGVTYIDIETEDNQTGTTIILAMPYKNNY